MGSLSYAANRSIGDETLASVDVLVIGAGGCGLTAALAAHAAGLEVAILEKGSTPGGNTALSSGSIPAAGTSLQDAAGIADSAECLAADLRAAAGRHDADALVAPLAGVSAELIEFLLSQDVDLTLVTRYRHVGHRTHRLHAPPSRRGADLVDDLLQAIAARDIPLALGQGATGLIVRDGRVTGAMVGDDAIAARCVILASNGFGANPQLLARHCPAAAQATYGGSPNSTGEALIWGQELGAATGNLGAYQGHAGLSTKTGALMTWTLVERGAVIVDAAGKRFANETLGYSAFADAALQATGPLQMIYDARIRDDVAYGQPEFAAACEMGVARERASAEALAEAIRAPADSLTATLDATRAAAAGLSPDPMGRTDWGLGPLGLPLCATEIEPALFHTQGGLKVDAGARVLDAADRPIPGLYAGGGAAMGISGRRGGAGYMSGNGLLSALGLGLIAARTAANDLAREHARSPSDHLRSTTRSEK